MKLKITAIFMAAMAAALLSGCVQAATTANTNVEVLEESEAVSVFALTATPTATPVITYVPEEIAELKAAASAIKLVHAEQSPLPEASDEPEAEPTATPASEKAASSKATPKPTETKSPEYTVKDMDSQKGYVYANSVNLRSGPGTDYDIIKEYKQYRELTVTGSSGEWYRVKVGSREGFMLMEYVKLGDVPKTTSKPTATPKPSNTPEPTPASAETPESTQAPASDMPSYGSYTSDELYLLAQLVYKEGDSSSYAAVANVILNRINSSKFPNTVEGVVYQKNQFSTSGLKTPSSAAKEAVTAVFVNGNTVLPSNVLYFRTSSSWSGHELYGKIGGNYFYY